MSETTSAPTSAPSPRTVLFRPAASDGHRVIYHEPICPDCGSFDVTEHEVDTGDGINEIALICQAAARLAGGVRGRVERGPLMPRRNHNARTVIDGDQLAAAIGARAAILPSPTPSSRAPGAASAATGMAATARCAWAASS